MVNDPYFNENVPTHVPAALVRDFNLYDHETVDPYLAVEALFEDGTPEIFWTRNNGGHWIVLGVEAIQGVGTDYHTFSATRLMVPDSQNNDTPTYPPNDTDPPLHTAYRGAIAPLFLPDRVETYVESIRLLTRSLIVELKARGECEFVEDFATQMPIISFLRILDFPEKDRLRLLEIASGVFNPVDEDHRARAGRDLSDYLEPYVQDRVANPRLNDAISHVVQQTDHGRPLDYEEIVKLVRSALLAGLDTVTSVLGFTARYLAENPETRHALIEDPKLHGRAIEELLRRYPVSASLGRYLMKDVVYRGVELKKGDHIIWGVGMYNFDRTRFSCPMEVKLDRKGHRHGSFGVGNHFCVGAPLARAELRIFMEEWLREIPDFRIKSTADVKYRGGFNTGLSKLPLVFGPA